MLRLLLDEHLSPRLADELPRHRAALEAIALRDFEGGAYRSVSDSDLIQAASAQGLTLLTYDLRTIPPLLKIWAETGVRHHGVIFVDQKSVAPNDVGGLIKSVCALFDALGEVDWTDRTVYLTRTG